MSDRPDPALLDRLAVALADQGSPPISLRRTTVGAHCAADDSEFAH